MAVGLPESENEIILPPGRGESYLVPILDALARVETQANAPFYEVLAARSAEIPPGSAVIALTADSDLRLAETLAGLAAQGFASHVIYVDAPPSAAGRDLKFSARRDDFIAALLAGRTQTTLLRRGSEGEASLERIENVAA